MSGSVNNAASTRLVVTKSFATPRNNSESHKISGQVPLNVVVSMGRRNTKVEPGLH
jgi:hypothetical protein